MILKEKLFLLSSRPCISYGIKKPDAKPSKVWGRWTPFKKGPSSAAPGKSETCQTSCIIPGKYAEKRALKSFPLDVTGSAKVQKRTTKTTAILLLQFCPEREPVQNNLHNTFPCFKDLPKTSTWEEVCRLTH